MKIYHYNQYTKLFINTGIADKNPVAEGEWILPAHSTTKEPPVTPAGKLAKFNLETRDWSLVDVPSTATEPVPYSIATPVEPVPITLDQQKLEAALEIDTVFGEMYFKEVLNSAIAAEYNAAFESARVWVMDMALPPPKRVVALAEIYEISNQEAARLVIAKWTEAQSSTFDRRGAARLKAKQSIKLAATGEAVLEALSQGKLAMADIKFSVK